MKIRVKVEDATSQTLITLAYYFAMSNYTLRIARNLENLRLKLSCRRSFETRGD